MTDIMRPFTNAEIRYFDEAEVSNEEALISNPEV